MTKEKQTEEMAKIICTPTANKGNCDKCGFKRHCSKFDDANDLYKAGYRKASDVAREIFEDIKKALTNAEYNAKTTRKTVKLEELKEQADWILHEAVLQIIEPIKKKYTEEGK